MHRLQNAYDLYDISMSRQGHAAEALVQLAAVDSHRRRLIVRASDILPRCCRLLASPTPASRYWGATLLQLLCQVRTAFVRTCYLCVVFVLVFGFTDGCCARWGCDVV